MTRGARASGAAYAPAVELYLHLCRISDTGTALSTLIGLFVFDNLGRLPSGLQEFLGARLSVKNYMLVVTFSVCWYLSCRWAGLYDWNRIKHRRSEMLRICLAASIGTLIAVIFPLTSVSGSFRMHVLLPFFALGTVLILLGRMLLRSAISRDIHEPSKIVIVGSGPRAQELFAQITSETPGHLHVMGFVDTALRAGTEGARCICSLDGLEQMLMTQEVDEVQVALPIKSCYAEIQRTIQICERVGVPVKYSASLFSHTRLEPRVELSAVGPLLSVPVGVVGPRLLVKRAIDILGAGAAMVLLSPLMLVVALAVRVTSRGPVLFSQLRYGRARRIFRMYKFRTMVEDAEARQSDVESLNEKEGPIFKIRRDPRTTWLGGILRHTSIDELPQLWNVLRGDMSLVGPRPMSLRDVKRFDAGWLMRRFSVYPGITGLWQVSGRSDLPFDDWIQLDLRYIDEWSLALDVRIMARTLPAVLSGRGAS
jgi:exopolysaccharide biosynthesis polyprenyl glycosylphosphotransferase